ncbi:MAG: hypothetical protein ICV62_16050, partial [Cyanobacteria bacterium Co-bin13]|nr:hypothetical protein [Cyanobacteria bacterium Co-bin13]
MTNRTIAELVSHLHSLDVQLRVEGEQEASLDEIRLRCTAPEGTLTAELRQELADRKAELVAHLHPLQFDKASPELQSPDLQPPDLQPIAPTSAMPLTKQGKGFPLSFAQQRLWFLDRLAPGSPVYNVPITVRMLGPLRPAVLAACFSEVVRR